jgi:beta-lactamase superfamily II metal-dependent hydrolase
MKYEIEMLSLGKADSSIIRFITDSNLEYVVLIDAGNPGDGIKIMNQIKTYTKQKYIDLAICTHPDKDHIGGFFDIVGKMDIKKFWIHDPSIHVNEREIRKSISDSRLEKSLKLITDSFDDSKNLLDLIDKNSIPRKDEPFSGLTHPSIPIEILGPTEEYYEKKLSEFRDIDFLYKEAAHFEKSLKDEIMIEEILSKTLDEQDDKSSENNSSIICNFEFENKNYLFTGDAGPEAFYSAMEKYEISNIHWLKVPHHGSKYNLNSDLIVNFNPKVAYIPAPGDKKYPSQAVINSLKKVNCRVYSTANANMLHNSIDNRDGYITATPL